MLLIMEMIFLKRRKSLLSLLIQRKLLIRLLIQRKLRICFGAEFRPMGIKNAANEASKVGSFGLAQEETIKLGQTDTDGSLYDIATITLYNGAYISFEIGGFDMTFEVSEDTADYLNGYFE